MAKRATLPFQIGVNGGYSKNEVVYYDEPATTLPWQSITGRPFNTPMLYNAIGVFKDQAAVDAYPHWPGARPGDIRFQDVDQDGDIDGDDRIRLENNTDPAISRRFYVGYAV